MNISEIEKIVKIFEISTLSKMEISGADVTIKLEKGTESMTVMPVAAAAQLDQKLVSTSALEVPEIEETGFWVTSPLVGTFYQSNVKDGGPLVQVGDTVKKGDLLCIIEAMKMMNEIRSDRDGVIKAVVAENESMLEFSQNIMCIGENK